MWYSICLSDQLFLDVLLMKIASKTISYATIKIKKRLDEKNEKDLENSIQSLEAKIVLTENEKRKLAQDKQEQIIFQYALSKIHPFALWHMTLWGTVDAEIKVPSFENPELTNVLPFIKPEVGQNTSTHAFPLP